MARTPTPDGKRNGWSVKLSDAKSGRADELRGDVPRALWLESLVDAAIAAADGAPAPVKRSREKRGGQAAPARVPVVPVSERLPKPPAVAVADVRAPAGTAVFRGPGADPVVTQPVPVIVRASDLPVPPKCPHDGVRRIGGWCPKCLADVKPGGRLPDGWVKPQGWTSHER